MKEEDEKLTIPSQINRSLPIYNPIFFYQLFLDLNSERERSILMTKELGAEKQRTQELESYLASFGSSNPKINRIDSCCSLASTVVDANENIPIIGAYSLDERRTKIQKYKHKLIRYRQNVKFSREFIGRSRVAKQKSRMKGKFVKSNE